MTLGQLAIKSLVPILIGAGLFASLPAGAINLGPAVPSADGVIYVSQYPLGDKPSGGTCPPATWTGLNLGDGGGTICDVSGDFAFTVTGSDTVDDMRIIHKDAGAGEVQVEGLILDSYAGSAESFAAIGLGIRESTAVDSWVAQCKSLQTGSTTIQCQYGTAPSLTNVNCTASGSVRPEWTAVTYYPTDTEVKGFTSSDGSTWTECFSTIKSMSDVLAFYMGGSRSATVALTGTIDQPALLTEIDAYTEDDTPGGVPTVSPIPDQTGSQGVAYSLTFSSYFTGATSYSLGSAFPGALTESSDGVLSGTPNATDASSSPYSRDLCGTNASGTTCDSVSFSFAAVPGDILVVASGDSVVDCDTFESGGRVDPGDVLQIDDGVRGPLEIRDCDGTAADPIIIRNDVTGTAAATIRRTSGTGPALELTNMTNFVMDGTGKWTGAASGTCGYDETTGDLGTTQCGIVVETQGGTGGFVIRLAGLSCAGTDANPNSVCMIKGVAVDGNNVSGVGLSMNDHSELVSDNPGTWRENLLVESSYFVDIGNGNGEAVYAGPNQDATAPDLPLRDITLRRNYFIGIERDCINTKSVLDGFLLIEYNYMTGCGESGESTQNRGLNLNGAADYTIRGNVILDIGGEGMLITWQDLAGLSPNASNTFDITNNIIARVGQTATAQRRDGIRFTRNSDSPTYTGAVSNNTLATVPEEGFSCGSNVTVNIRNSIAAGVSGTVYEGSGCNNAGNNATGSVASFNFVNSGADNYELTSSSSTACNLASATYAPATDYEGEARPQDSADDIGADEATACP